MADRRPTHPTAVLERRYRWLMLAYPAPYRADRGAEVLTTLLDMAQPGQRVPRVAEATDLLAAGVRQRFGTGSIAGFSGGLAVAAPIALVLAAGISAFAWWRVEPMHPGIPIDGAALLGTFRTLGPIAYAAWLLAALSRVLLRPELSRVCVGVAIVVTVAGVPLLAAVTSVDRPPLWILMALTALGGIAFTSTSPPSTDERLAVVTGVVAFALSASAITLAWPPPGDGWSYYQPTIARVGVAVEATVAVIAVIAIIRLTRRQPADEWLWATVLLGLPGGWLGPFDTATLWLPGNETLPRFGRLAQVLLASCVAMIMMVVLAQRRTPGADPARPPDQRALARVGAVALGCAAGLATLVGLATTGMAGFAPTALHRVIPAHVVVTLAVLVVVGGTACLAGGARAVVAPWWTLTCAASTSFAAAWLVAAYGNGWTFPSWAGVARTATLATTIAFVPLTLCAATAVSVLHAPDERRTATRPAAMVVLAVSVGWLSYLTLPYLLTWSPVLLVFAACAVVLAIAKGRTFSDSAAQTRGR